MIEAFRCSNLLLKSLDSHVEIYWFHKPVVVTRPILVWVLQLEIEVAYDLWYELGHFEIGNMSADTRPGAETELQMLVSILKMR